MANNVFQFPGTARSFDGSPSSNPEIGEDSAYQLRLEIKHMETPVWRRLMVHPLDSLDDLGLDICTVFEWSGEAEFYFEKGADFYDCPSLYKRPKVVRHTGDRHFNAAEVRTGDALRVGDVCSFTYDLEEDYWDVTVVVEKQLVMDDTQLPILPLCIGGKSAAPFECVGGPDGYEHFLGCVNNVGSAEYFEAREWAGIPFDGVYDINTFSIMRPNAMFALQALDEADELIPKDYETLKELAKTLMAERLSSIAYAMIVERSLDPDGSYGSFYEGML